MALSDDQWGHGDLSRGRPCGWTKIGENDHGTLELFFGEHPHSRRDNNVYARDDHGAVHDFDGHRVLLDITIKSFNYLKEGHYSGDEIRKGGTCTIFADRDPIYAFFFRDPQYALLKAHGLITTLSEHSLPLLTKEGRTSIIGRKVYWDRTPAVITRLLLDQGCVIVEAEPGHKFPAPVYEKDPEDWQAENGQSLKDDILGGKFWWHRD